MDQPSSPRKDQLPFQVSDDKLTLGHELDQAILIRENPQTPSDPLAYLIAIGNAAIMHGLTSAHDGSPFIPFLIADSNEGRSLNRFVTNTPDEAQQAARKAAHNGKPKACAYACDGYVTEQGNRFDAVLVEVSQFGLVDGLVFTQPYTFNNRKVQRAG